MTTPRGHQRWDQLAAGFALHALSPDDEQEFLIHADSCKRCLDAVVVDAAVTEQLAGLVPAAAPPARLRTRVLAITDDVTEGLESPTAIASRRRPRVLLAAAAAVLLLAVGVNLASRPTSAPSTPAGAIRACQADEGCRFFALTSVGDNLEIGAVVVRGTEGRLVAEGLKPNDATTSTYVLWQKAGRGPVLALATFDVTQGTTILRRDLRAPLAQTDWLAVSIEKGRVAPPTPSVPVALALVSAD